MWPNVALHVRPSLARTFANPMEHVEFGITVTRTMSTTYRVPFPVASLRLSILACLLLLISCGGTTNSVKGKYLADTADLARPPVRPVIIMSGFGQMKLFDPVTHRNVWGTAHTMVQTRWADDMDLPVDPLTAEVGRDRLIARGFVGSRTSINHAWHLGRILADYAGYVEANDFLSPLEQEPKTLYRLSYDFRLSASDNARTLDRFIEDIRQAHGEPLLQVDLVTHSLGGIVALTYLKIGTAPLDEPSRWDEESMRAASKIKHAVIMAAPQEGTIDAFRVMVQSERFALRVLFPEWSALFPALIEILPGDGRALMSEDGSLIEGSLWDVSTWQRLELSIFNPAIRERMIQRTSRDEYHLHTQAFEKLLLRGQLLREALRRPIPEGIVFGVIASDCVPTTRRAVLRSDGSMAFYRDELRPSEQALANRMFEPGDGSITVSSATAGRTRDVSLICDGHQGMALDPTVHRAIIRTLESGGAPGLMMER